MNHNDSHTVPARRPGATIVYYAITILLLPVFLLGYVIWTGALFSRRKSSASATAQAPLFARWLTHRLGSRPDAGANRLLPIAPGIPPLGWRLVSGPILVAHRFSGYVPKGFRYPFEGEITLQNQGSARQTFYDRVVQQITPQMTQFVILGAGYDTRALNLPKNAPVRSFEVDTPATSAGKRVMLVQAGLDTTGVVLVAADFEKEDWLTKLIENGFDPGKPTLFIWEGVTMYLERAAVEATLRKIAGLAQGTVIAFDYFTTEVLESKAMNMRAIRASLKAGGEPLKFGIDATPPLRERLAEFLQRCALSLVEQRTLGQETAGKQAWGGFAIAAVK